MIITKEQFQAYENVRVSGVTSMWNTGIVSDLSGLDREEVLEIMKHYSDLKKQYPDVQEK